MSPLVPVGLAIVLNVGVLAGGLIWAKRQVRRVAAERATAYRELFRLEPLPSPGDEVQALVEDEEGLVAEIEAVYWPHLGWTNARTFLRVEEDVLGWRRHPLRLPAVAAPTDWTREKVAAELAKLTDDDEHR